MWVGCCMIFEHDQLKRAQSQPMIIMRMYLTNTYALNEINMVCQEPQYADMDQALDIGC